MLVKGLGCYEAEDASSIDVGQIRFEKNPKKIRFIIDNYDRMSYGYDKLSYFDLNIKDYQNETTAIGKCGIGCDESALADRSLDCPPGSRATGPGLVGVGVGWLA